MYISLWENSRGHPDNVSFMQFSTKIDGFEQKDSQGFENSYNSYEQYPLEKFFIFTIYQNYTLALSYRSVLRVTVSISKRPGCLLIHLNIIIQHRHQSSTIFKIKPPQSAMLYNAFKAD